MYKKKFIINNKYLSNFFNNLISILFINWVFQGIRIKSIHEILFFLFLEISFFLLFNKFFVLPILTSFIFAHTFNWLFNGHLWVILRYSHFYNSSIDSLQIKYDYIVKSILSSWMIDEAIIIGSFTFDEKKINTNSDIDVRLFFNKYKNFIKINFSLFIFRFISLFKIIPLDISAINDLSKIKIFSKKEKIIIIKDKNNRIKKFLNENNITYENYKH